MFAATDWRTRRLGAPVVCRDSAVKLPLRGSDLSGGLEDQPPQPPAVQEVAWDDSDVILCDSSGGAGGVSPVRAALRCHESVWCG